MIDEIAKRAEEYMEKAVKGIRILVGAQLSKEEIMAALPGRKAFFPFDDSKWSKASGASSETNIYRDGDKIIKEIIDYSYATTRDVSESSRAHTGWYPVGRDIRVYDSQGLLERKIIGSNKPLCPGSEKVTVHEPAGNVFGRVVSKSGGFWYD